ncbi:MAG: molybdopterin-dependent oxidoreductase [Nitrospirota bacterium]|nr:molybdopterin-dependent oxidoreductase [Nitrospirota bacterium]MDH5768305.1 molybdopterin-dependent oxidoreductase [Nitrospirota bacterium]
MIELTIDGKRITAEKGDTILQAALKNGIYIPNLCYDRRLLPYAGCRVCIVEIEGQRKLEASCATLAKDGMVVRTDTPKMRKARQTVLELMLVHHPLDCPICDKAGECDLQDVVYKVGKSEGRFIRHRREAPADVRGPLIELNANRCILCGKCVRICDEHQGRVALGFIGRGFPTSVQAAFGEILECDYCGQCVDICPTGAMLSKAYRFEARPFFLEEKDTICSFCSVGCTLTLGIREGKILRSRGKEGTGVTDGNLCGRGRFGFDYIYSESRLKTPMIRKDGVLTPASWEEALGYINDNLKSIIDHYGPSSIGAIGSHRCTNEDNYMLQKFMRNVIGSHNIDSSAAFGYALVEKAWEMAFGQKNHKIDLKSPLNKDVILILESDPSITHPIFGLNIMWAKRKKGANLVVADSRETKLTRYSSQWLKIKPGTGVALLNGIMKVIIDKGLFDKEKVSTVAGFSSLMEVVKEYTPETVHKITGITEEELTTVAEIFAKAKSRMVSLSIGISENTKGLDTVLAAANLINLLGDSADSLQIPAEYSNTFGLYQVMRLIPDAVPGYKLSDRSGKDVLEMLYETDSLNALYIVGEDPVVTFPNSSKIIGRLKALNLLIVQDIALTETAKLANVVLPASSWAEKDGTFTNAEGLTQRLHKVVSATGNSLPDWQIIRNLSQTMGEDIGIKHLEDISEEIKTSLESHQPSLPSGKRALYPVHYIPGEESDADYQLSMIVRDVLHHSGSISTRSESLNLVASEALLEISEQDAERRGILDNSYVKVSSRRGTVYLKAKVSDAIPEGTVYVPTHFPHGRVNTLIHLPVNGGISIDAVKVEPVKA